ncbi:hypothetical protein [Cedecea colo]|nr:hypothetical protein [Cedecea colo]
MAVNNLSALNVMCEENKELRGKMDEKLKYQCDSAKEVSEYIKTLTP